MDVEKCGHCPDLLMVHFMSIKELEKRDGNQFTHRYTVMSYCFSASRPALSPRDQPRLPPVALPVPVRPEGSFPRVGTE